MVFKKFYVKKTSVKMSCNPYKDINECQEEQGLCGDHGRCVNLVSMSTEQTIVLWDLSMVSCLDLTNFLKLVRS